jgi:hypothetical protein
MLDHEVDVAASQRSELGVTSLGDVHLHARVLLAEPSDPRWQHVAQQEVRRLDA